jgi:hypothetical protein
VPGNHDLLVQGVVAPTPATRHISVGDRKLVQLDEAALEALRGRDAGAADALLRPPLPGRTVRVTPDARRRELSPAEVMRGLHAPGTPAVQGPLMDRTVDVGSRVRVLLLDTTRRDGGTEGVLRPPQTAWLAEQLRSAGTRWIVVASATPLRRTAGAGAALAAIAQSARVAVLLAGDTHRNSITPVRTPAGGYWEITTSSLADYPQQVRALRLRAAPGGLVVDTWMLDADPASRLARVSRELAYLDVQGGRPAGLAGHRGDRNARLFLAR